MLTWRNIPKLPPGGHHFTEPDGTKLTGHCISDVVDAMTQHRARNSLPLGDPEQEVLAYYATIAPRLVKECDQSLPDPSFRQQVAERIMAVWHGQEYVRHDPIPGRSERCLVCECLCEQPTGPESSYTQLADVKAAVMLGSINVTENGYCRHHKLPISLLIRAENPQELGLRGAPQCCFVASNPTP